MGKKLIVQPAKLGCRGGNRRLGGASKPVPISVNWRLQRIRGWFGLQEATTPPRRDADPLLIAAAEGNLEAVARIVRQRKGTHAHGDGTALHRAAEGGHERVAKLLLVRGACVNARDRAGETPLHHAAGTYWTQGRELIVRLLLECGGNVNARTYNKWTPLHGCALTGSTAIAELLIEAGAHVRATAEDELTPLDIALRDGRTGVAVLLRQHGAA